MTVTLIPPEELPSIQGLDDPRRFYQVLQDPAPFAGMSFPDIHQLRYLASLGFRSIVCLTSDTPPYDPAPLEMLRSVRFKDLIGGSQPKDPKREADLLKDVVRAVVHELDAKRGVAVHCQGGTGRTGTVIACCLRELGVATDEVLAYMHNLNKVREKYPGWKGWPESGWQRCQVTDWASLS